jgi:ABC-type multidrug transport system fused ATPase/permease subunit
MTGISGVSALSSVVIGAIGVAMTLVGGHAILDGSMTLGDWVMYVFFTGRLAAPLIQISSIGTQITEALAGLDRIREIRKLATEDAGDAERSALPSVRGDVRFDDVSFALRPRGPGALARLVPRARGLDDGPRRLERLGEEHADRASSWPSTGPRPAASSSTASTSRPSGLHDYRSHLGSCCRTTSSSTARSRRTSPIRGRGPRARSSWPPPASRTATSSSPASRRATTR